jgi:heme/copper-type cytochrome/quinol oxidase subunit 3
MHHSILVSLWFLFYMATGFHGFHVFVGTIALFVSFIRSIINHFTDKHHFDLSLLFGIGILLMLCGCFLFINIYWWSSR